MEKQNGENRQSDTSATCGSKSAVERLVSLDQLKPGTIVRGRSSGAAYMVTCNYGNRVTAVRTQDITNPDEWEIVNRW